MSSMRNSGRAAACKSNHIKAIGWASPRFGAAVMALVQLPNVLHAQTSGPRSAAATQAVTQPPYVSGASGVLEGTVTIACQHGAIDCKDRPYHVGLFIQGEQRGIPPIQVYASPRFSITLEPGSYIISSADVRGSWSLPSLQPMNVAVASGQTTHVDVRFAPGHQLPMR